MTNVERIIEVAKKNIGADYFWGGNDPKIGFDTSGFVQYVFAMCGFNLPRTSFEQYDVLKVNADSNYYSTDGELLKEIPLGSVLFNKQKTHVGIYIGNGEYIHAPYMGEKVQISNIKYSNMVIACSVE